MNLRIAVTVGVLVFVPVNRAAAEQVDRQQVESFLRYERIDRELSKDDARTLLLTSVGYAPQRLDLTIDADGSSLLRFTRMWPSNDGDKITWTPLPEEASQFTLTEGEMSALRFAAGDTSQWKSRVKADCSTPGLTVTMTVDGAPRASTVPPTGLERLLERLVDQCVFVKDLAKGRRSASATWAVAMAFRPADLRNPLLSYLKSNPAEADFVDALRALQQVVSPVEYSGLVAADRAPVK